MLGTATKIRIARGLAATLLRLGVRPQRVVRRQGITYDLDLREGIDLSLFLFGSFQRHVTDAVRRFAGDDGVVIDVGANIGAVTLPVAACLQRGHVYAFEPTAFAFAKLQRNLSLNPELARRVTALNLFVAERSAPTSDLVAYSSWPVAGAHAEAEHPVHKGVAKAATCGQTTLDDFLAERGLRAVALIKVDTDGHDFPVLAGAARCLSELRPVVIFEACEYLMTAPQPTFEAFEALFRSHRYAICDGERLTPIAAAEFRSRCPEGGGLDLIAVPEERLPALRS